MIFLLNWPDNESREDVNTEINESTSECNKENIRHLLQKLEI